MVGAMAWLGDEWLFSDAGGSTVWGISQRPCTGLTNGRYGGGWFGYSLHDRSSAPQERRGRIEAYRRLRDLSSEGIKDLWIEDLEIWATLKWNVRKLRLDCILDMTRAA